MARQFALSYRPDARITGTFVGFILTFSIPMWMVLLIGGGYGENVVDALVLASIVFGAVISGGLGAAIGLTIGTSIHCRKKREKALAKH